MNVPSNASLQAWQRIAFTYKFQRDSTGRMLADTTAAYHTYKVEQPKKQASAEKKAHKVGFISGFKWGGGVVTILLAVIAIVSK
ncbi:hypothetical protein [Siphonobacter sp.]|uniref:hypothetical protein n=1 Tax=Siphonobacter sp. TaxID=1869184 RepID=UPI003B3A36D4